MASESELQGQAIQAASKVMSTSKKRELPKEIELSNGIVLSVKPMPPMLLNSVANSIPEPEVPKVYLEDKGRDEPNPNHPDYLRAVAERNAKVSLATINCILYACTTLKYVPDGMWKVEDDDWLPLAEMANIPFVTTDKVQRYLAWLRVYAIATVDDLSRVQTVPLMLAGITEEEVDEALSSFRSGEGRDADSGVSAEGVSANGNHVPDADTGPRPRTRRA